jgi:hypothetical protein
MHEATGNKPQAQVAPVESDYKAVPEMRGTEQIGVTFERRDKAQIAPIDIEAMLAAMVATLAKAIAQEQDDTLNDDLCELYERADGIRERYIEAVHDEFQDDTPPNAPKEANVRKDKG